MRDLCRYVLIICASVAAGGCDSPTAPIVAVPPASTRPTTREMALRIVSGAPDRRPVSGATVVVDGDRYVTNDKGEVTVHALTDTYSLLEVNAPGFLERRTKVPQSLVVTLWPVADEAEAQAVRSMAYLGSGSRVETFSIESSPIVVSSPTLGADTQSAWSAEAAALGQTLDLSFQVSNAMPFEGNVMTVRVLPVECGTVAEWGFCRVPYSRSFHVLPAKELDPVTIRRVLVSFFLGSNPLPGLMNPVAPDTQLSPLELQTIRMMLQRTGTPNRWPDTDR